MNIAINELVSKVLNVKGEHAIGLHTAKDEETCKQIVESGLDMHYHRSVLGEVASMGETRDNYTIGTHLTNYNLGGRTRQTNVVLVFPKYLSRSTGERIYLGCPALNMNPAGGQYEQTTVLDHVARKMGRIPREFILGYYTTDDYGKQHMMGNPECDFHENENFIDKLPQEKVDSLFDEVKANLEPFVKMISDGVVTGNLTGLTELKKKMEEMGLNSTIVKKAITEVELRNRANSDHDDR